MMTFKRFFLQSFKATEAPRPASRRSVSTKLRNKIWDRLAKPKAAKHRSGLRMSGITRYMLPTVAQRTNGFSAAVMSNNLDSRLAASVPGGPPNSSKQSALSGSLWIGFENRSRGMPGGN
jgi:hypothetical protein